MANFLEQDWFGGIKDFNKNIGMRDFLDNTDNALGGTGIINWPNHFDDLYESDSGTRSATNLAALIYGGILAGGAMGGGAAGVEAGAGAGASEGAGAGAAEASPWVESSSGMYTLPGEEAGVSAGTGLMEPSAGGGFNWQRLAQQGMKGMSGNSGNTSGNGPTQDQFDPYGLRLSGLPADSFQPLEDSQEDKRQKVIDAMSKKDKAWW